MPPAKRRVSVQGGPKKQQPSSSASSADAARKRRPDQKRSKRLCLLLAVAILVVVVGGLVGRLSFPSDSPPPHRTVSSSPPSFPSQEANEKQGDKTHLSTSETPGTKTEASAPMQKRVVIVGAGLAGQSAAIVAAQNGAQVYLLDKESRLGGNSAKATSGINGWGTAAQATQGVHDSPKLFERDTFLSGKGGNCRPGLVRMLSMKSASAVSWLSSFGIPLDVLSQLGGHSRKRTHRAPDKPDGTPLPIGYTTVSTLEKYIRGSLSEKVHIEPDSTMLRLLHEKVRLPNGEDIERVTGVEYRKRFPIPKGSEEGTEAPPQVRTLEADAVILATGGFSNDHTDNSLLAEYAPNLSGFPTTNGPWATGDGVKAAKAIGAELVDMDKVQLHPTGLLNPKDPMAKTVFLGPEALRGSGGILVNKEGERFINELELRSVVSQAILHQGNEFPESGGRKFAYCILNEPAADAFGRVTLGFYWKKMGLFTQAEDVPALAKLIGCDEDKLQQTLGEYERVSSSNAKCPKTGKTVYPCVLGPQGPFYVAYVTPSIHYTMGGCLISPSAEIQSTTQTMFGSRRRPILGLFGAGEVTGGVHGNNRLGGNSLLECVVFGRIAGERAALATNEFTEAFPAGSAEGGWVKGVVEEFLPEDGDEGDGTTRGGQLIFTLPSASQTSGLQLGQAIGIRGVCDGEMRVVYLHPSTTPNAVGSVGVYLPSPHSAFATPATSWLYKLQPGDAVELIAGPGSSLLWDRLVSGETDELVIFATAPFGVGATLQLLQAAMEEPLRSKLKKVRLVYAARNVTELSYRNILGVCQSSQASEDGGKFLECKFIVEDPPGKWTGGVGVISTAAAADVLPAPESPRSQRVTVVQAGDLASTRPVHVLLMATGYAEGTTLFSLLE